MSSNSTAYSKLSDADPLGHISKLKNLRANIITILVEAFPRSTPSYHLRTVRSWKTNASTKTNDHSISSSIISFEEKHIQRTKVHAIASVPQPNCFHTCHNSALLNCEILNASEWWIRHLQNIVTLATYSILQVGCMIELDRIG